MTAREAISQLSELHPNEQLAIGWFRQSYFAVSATEWDAAVKFADTTPWLCIGCKIEDYLTTQKGIANDSQAT